MNITAFVNSMKKGVAKNSSAILTGIGIAGMITTTVLAVRATPKALYLIDEKEAKQAKRLAPKEVVSTAWKCYIPAAVTGALSVVCLIGANSVNARRNTALAAAYTLSESTLKEYQEKVVETVGARKEEAVRDSVAKDKLDRNPVNSKEVILTQKGDTLCYDVVSGRYFKSDIDKLKKAENNLNRQMRDDMYITLNEFYCEIGLPTIPIGDDLGWNIDNGYIDLRFSSQLADDGTPCLVIDYQVAPQYGI